MNKKLLFRILLVLGIFSGQVATAQIIDDSTEVVYSPKTTLQLFEQDVLNGRYVETRIDTSIQNTHNERFWFQDSAYYQHLGNIGTASQPLLFRMPNKIGARLGRHAFDRYAYNPRNINYYDTRSPYSHLYYVQGGRGEQVFEAIYARNITPNWNIGAAYQIISAEKQLATSPQENGLISGRGAKIFSHYTSKDKKYDLFANFTLFRHEQVEQGGVRRPEEEGLRDNLFLYENGTINLQQATTQEKRSTYHLLHMYKLAQENLKVYHQFDLGFQEDDFTDDGIPLLVNTATNDTSVYFYPRALYSTRLTRDQSKYRELENIVGFTGRTKISSYKVYAKLRNSKLTYNAAQTIRPDADSIAATLTQARSFNQVFVGGELSGFYKKAEVVLSGEVQVPSDYRVKALARLGGAYGSLERVLQSPSLTETFILSNHFDWDNEDRFNNSVYDRLEVGYASKFGERQFLRVTGHVNNIKRYFYFDEQFTPQQEARQRLFGAELQHHIHFGSIHFENFIAYTNTSDADKIRVPEWLLDSKLYFEGSLFKKALYGQFGVQAYLPSSYYGDGYMPVTQQFYIQNELKTAGYPVLDVFLTADIKTLNIFLKMSHINSELWEPGYLETPYYPGMRRSFVFGIKWMFFD